MSFRFVNYGSYLLYIIVIHKRRNYMNFSDS